MMYLDERGRKKFDYAKVESLLRDRDIIKVLAILKRENLAELVDYEGTTLLHLSARYNNQFLMNYLIRNKDFEVNFYVNAINSLNETPLMISIHWNNDVDTLKFLLEAGADLWKIKNNSGRSALTMIFLKYNSYDNNTSILELVMAELEKRCRNIVELVDVLLSAGCQPCHLKMYKKAEITKLLIQRGCRVNFQNPEDAYNTALHVAAESNDVDNVKVLLKFGADQYIKNGNKILPIENIVRCDNPNPEIIRLLWPADKDWMFKSMNMGSIFAQCKKDVLQLIFKHCEVNLNAIDSGDETPLHYLAENRNTPRHFWESLKNGKLEVNGRSISGLTPLFRAVIGRNLEAIRFLLDAGADVNALDKSGRSPLFYNHWTLARRSWGIEDCFKLLIENGANALLVAHDGNTILSCPMIVPDFDALDSIIHHFVLIKARGSIINTIILDQIESDIFTKNCLAKCKRELDDMKTEKLSGNVTCYNFLIDKDQKILRYVKNEEMVNELSKCEGKSYFHKLLIERFEKTMKIKGWRTIAGQLIGECIETLKGYDLIIEIILDFLDYSDWELMAKTDEVVK